MREHGLQRRRRRRYVATTDSDHDGPIFPDLAKDVVPDGPDQLWVADLTYVAILGGFAYVAVILDAWSRRVAGYAIARSIDARLTLAALRAALEVRRPAADCIHHSDRGSQLGLNRSTQHYPELTAAQRREPRQVSSIPTSCAACCSGQRPLRGGRQRHACSGPSPRCAAAPARSSTALAPDGARPHARQDLPPATARYPLAPQRSGSARSAPLTTATDGTGPSRLPRETTGTRQAAIQRPSSLRPRSSAPRRPTPRTVADAPAALQAVALATVAFAAETDPTAADPPSHHPPPGVLRRPIESTQYAAKAYRDLLDASVPLAEQSAVQAV